MNKLNSERFTKFAYDNQHLISTIVLLSFVLLIFALFLQFQQEFIEQTTLPMEEALPLTRESLIRSLLILSTLAGLIIVTQSWSARRTRMMHENLEQRVSERTAALAAVNRQLERGMRDQELVEKQLSAVLNTMGEGIVIIDRKYKIVMVNHASSRIWGYNPGELINEPLTQLMTGDMRQLNQLLIRSANKSTTEYVHDDQRLQTTAIRKNKTQFPVEVGIARMEIDDQQFFTIVARDVTSRKQMEDTLRDERTMLAQRVEARTVELRRANTELGEAAKMKDEFLASMSHELRTPLNAILGLSEALLEDVYGVLAERMINPLNLIGESGLHLLELINDILDVSKIAAGKLTLDRSGVQIRRVCEASLAMVRQTATQKDIRMQLEVDPEVDWIYADGRRLKQIIVNLLSNAVKFTPNNGAVGLQVKGDKVRSQLYITVVDTGIGIPQSEFKGLFDPFVQVDSSLSRKYNGTGLGLALVSRLTKLHKGSVSINSLVGEGSRFVVTIPWLRWDEGNKQEAKITLQKIFDSVEIMQPTIFLDGHPPHILLAEDKEINITTVCDYLEYKGYRVSVARNGVEAVAMAETYPLLILMDIQMPKMDGLEATRRIRANPLTAEIPIIALTGLAMAGDKDRCLKAGANDYISKPFQLEQLSSLIERQIGQVALHQKNSGVLPALTL